jgi:hypothetical protein
MPYTPSETGKLDLTACGNPPGGPGWVAGYPLRDYADHGSRTYDVVNNPITISAAIATSTPPMAGVPPTAYYQVQNRSSTSIDTGVLWICSALNGKPYGSGSAQKTLAPNEVLTVSMPYTPSETGKLELTACGNPPGGPGWVPGYPTRQYYDHGYRTYSVTKNPITISAAIATTSQPRVGVPTTLYFNVQNRSTQTIDTGVLWICTALNGKPYGSGAVQKVLAPNETLAVTMPYTPAEKGTLVLTACGNYPGGSGWQSWYPTREYADHGTRTYTVN